MFAKISEFTAAAGKASSKKRVMTQEDTEFIASMVIDELLELLVTQSSIEDARDFIVECATKAKSPKKLHFVNDAARIAEQADALVDVCYYAGDAAARAGWRLDPVFEAVHQANMAKLDPDTGKFIVNASGKIIKPAKWVEPDVRTIMDEQ